MPTTSGSLTIFGAIEQKWLLAGGLAGALGAPVTNEAPTFDGTGRAQAFKGGLISWHPTVGAQIVWGAILARWIELGREKFGYPITDEMTCPDHIGKFNHFRALQLPGSPDASIYWTLATGAHEIYGSIREKWASMGWERSPVGYPLQAERDQAGGGRTQRFQHGVITWLRESGAAEHEVSGDSVTFNSGPVTSNLPLGGAVQLVLQRSGTAFFSTHAHDSGFDNIDYLMSAVLVTATGKAITFQQAGHVEGTIAGLPFGTPQRNDDSIKSGSVPAVAANWDDIVTSGRLLCSLTGTDKLVSAMSDLLSGAASAVAAAGVTALVGLI